ncbi:MAG: 6-pyruvoyl-tetrahydropterin synthase-related protein [Anaerolineae bacterium]
MSSKKLEIRIKKLEIRTLLHPSSFLFYPSYFWLTLLLSLPAIGPLLQPGYFWGAHDARHAVYFLYEFDRAIQDGMWYPRWSPDFAFGYGYPFFNVYSPLPFYLGEVFHLGGLDIVASIKVVFGLSAILSGLSMYFFAKHLLGRPAALIASLVYVYAPYHLYDLYVRADLAESAAFVFVPLVLWTFYEAINQPRLSTILWRALFYAGLMLTHSLSAFILAALMGLYVAYMMLWQIFKTVQLPIRVRNLSPLIPLILKLGLPSLFVLLLGLGLSSIYFLPALIEARYVRTDQWFGGRFAFGDDFVELFQLFSPRWGFGASIPGPDDNTGFQIGLAALILFVLSFLIVPRLTNSSLRRTLHFFQATTLLMAFLTTPLSGFIYQILPLAQLIQFPWRLLVVVVPFISVLAGAILAEEVSSVKCQVSSDIHSQFRAEGSLWAIHNSFFILHPSSFPLILLVSLVLLASYPYLQAEVRDPKPTEGPVSQAALFRFQQSSDEMTGQTAWVQRIPNWSSLAEQVERGGQITSKVNYSALPADNSVGVYSMEMDSIHELLWVGTEKEGQSVTFLIPYYPGWQAYLYQDLGPHDGNLDKAKGPVTRVGPLVERPALSTTPIEGWMVVPIPTGPHFLELRFEDTLVRIVGRWISAVSLLIVIGMTIFSVKREV